MGTVNRTVNVAWILMVGAMPRGQRSVPRQPRTQRRINPQAIRDHYCDYSCNLNRASIVTGGNLGPTRAAGGEPLGSTEWASWSMDISRVVSVFYGATVSRLHRWLSGMPLSATNE